MKTTTSALTLATLLLITCTTPANADGEAEFLLFLSADDLERRSVMAPEIQTSDFTPTIDFLFTYNNGPWRILGEYFATDDEAELERLQLGYEFSSESTLWFGRFHQPVSAWNHQYHHGAYLQPSISRPSVENWEDDGGVIPAHITGFMLDSTQSFRKNESLRYVASFGFAPLLVEGELQPFDVLDPDEGASRPAASLNVSYYPDIVGETNVGLIAGYAEIEAPPDAVLGNTSTLEIRQKLLGAQANLEGEKWGLVAAAYYVDNKSHGSIIVVDDWFSSGYVQLLGALSENTTLYARVERTRNEGSDYLRLFSDYLDQRDLIGFRWDFAKRQALAIEISENSLRSDDFSEVLVQWSAVLP